MSGTISAACVVTSTSTSTTRALLSPFQIKLSEVVGTGKDGRILKEDILNYLADQTGAILPPAPAPAPAASGSPAVAVKASPTSPRPVFTGRDVTESLKGLTSAQAHVCSGVTTALASH